MNYSVLFIVSQWKLKAVNNVSIKRKYGPKTHQVWILDHLSVFFQAGYKPTHSCCRNFQIKRFSVSMTHIMTLNHQKHQTVDSIIEYKHIFSQLMLSFERKIA